MAKQITIKDIARELGLHHSTVSRALRNDPRIHKNTKKRVREYAEQHHYQPNSIAINLRDASSKTIGIIVPSIHHHYFSHIISVISDLAFKAGYSVIISQSNESLELEIQNTMALVQSRVAGVIASISRETDQCDHFEALLEKDIPLVFFDRVCEKINTGKVIIKNRQGAQMAVDHLVRSGCRRIAYLGGCVSTNVFRDRVAGYRESMEKHKLEINENWIVCSDFSFQAGRQGMRRVLSLPDRPDAILTVSFELAMGAWDEIRNHGLEIPKDIALVSFGEEPMSRILHPGITTIAQPRERIAREAMGLLIEQMGNQGKDAHNHQLWLDTELIVRGSSMKTWNVNGETESGRDQYLAFHLSRERGMQ